MYSRNLLIADKQDDKELISRKALVNTAVEQVGVREKSGNNDGIMVEAYLATVKLKRGEPWCAAFISWVYQKNGYLKPRSGWCPDLFPASRLARSALPADVIGIYFPDKKRIAHVGLVVAQNGSWISDIEGNTNVAGGREGDGVYKKLRHLKTVHSIANWVTERRPN